MSRSAGEINAYKKLKEKLAELNAQLGQLPGVDQMQLAVFQTVITRISKKCDLQSEPPADLWKQAKEQIEGFIKKNTKSENEENVDHISRMLSESLFDQPSSPKRKSPPPLPQSFQVKDENVDLAEVNVTRSQRSSSSHVMFHDMDHSAARRDSQLVTRQVAKVLEQLKIDSLDDLDLSVEELATKHFDVAAQSAETLLLMLQSATKNYIDMAEKFLGPADPKKTGETDLARVDPKHFKTEHDAVRTRAIQVMLIQLRALQKALVFAPKGGDRPEVKKKVAEAQLTAANQIVSIVDNARERINLAEKGKFNAYEKTTMGKMKSVFGSKKVSITDIFNLNKAQAPTIESMAKTFAQLNGLEMPRPRSPRASSTSSSQ